MGVGLGRWMERRPARGEGVAARGRTDAAPAPPAFAGICRVCQVPAGGCLPAIVMPGEPRSDSYPANGARVHNRPWLADEARRLLTVARNNRSTRIRALAGFLAPPAEGGHSLRRERRADDALATVEDHQLRVAQPS